MESTMFEHLPVMLLEAVEGLLVRPGGIYVDGTLGGGGHAFAVLEKLGNDGLLIGIDRDRDAIAATSARMNDMRNFRAVHGNFHDLTNILHDLEIDSIDGILVDLGVSSYQLDTPERGFSYRFDGQLDMRMDQSQKKSAHDIVNLCTEKELADIIFSYGEERYARRIARRICEARRGEEIQTTAQLAKLVEGAVPGGGLKYGPNPAMRTFMALRIAVNDELTPLDGAITNAIEKLRPGGRICVITFHSLEDRITKTCFARLANPCECPRDLPVCGCGKRQTVRVITKKPILPVAAELADNPRASSAKLRIAEKL